MATGPRLSINCPHCDARARVRTSREETPLVRSVNLQCTNLECGHTFAAKLEITHTIAPSQRPSADIVLPMTPVSLRRSIGAADLTSGTGQDRRPIPHNDNGGPVVPQPPPAQALAGLG